ncbi:MAG: DUF3087 family protein [Shewanella sp.]
MPLPVIDKSRYRKHLNLFLLAFVLSLMVLSLSFGAGLIALFGAEAIAGQPTGNFHLNLLGVILAVVFCSAVVLHVKSTAFFTEIDVVWQLKQRQNRIFRKLAKIKAAAAQHDANAMIILLFYYTSLQQVYHLDDNTLTLSTLSRDLAQLQAYIQELGLNLSAEQFTPSMLDAF